MNPSRPYKCLYDVVTDAGKIFTQWMTLNLFDVDNWAECSNELEGFKDDVKRTIVRTHDRSFICQIAYKAFDNMMIQIKADYGLLDNRSLIPPDKIGYKGFIQAQGSSTRELLAVTFHRKGFKTESYEEFAYHAIFSNVNPMS